MIGAGMAQVRVRANLERRTPRGAAPVSATSPVRQGVTGLWLAAMGSISTAALVTHVLRSTPSGSLWRVDDVVALAISAVGALVAAWYALTGAALTLGSITRRGLGITRWGAPLARRLGRGLAVAAVGAGVIPGAAWASVPDDLTIGGLIQIDDGESARVVEPPLAVMAPAANQDGTDHPSSEGREGEAGAPEDPAATAVDGPENADKAENVDEAEKTGDAGAAGAADGEAEATNNAGAHLGPSASGTYVVQAGDCLWWIAEAELPAGSSDARIARRVSDWVDTNPGLRANPDLILISQRLTIPGGLA